MSRISANRKHRLFGKETSTEDRGQRIALGVVFVWFLLGGIAHFVFTELEMRIVPPGLPWPRALVLVTGVFELLGAAGLLLPRTRRMAGWGLIALTVAVTPANIYMLMQHEMFDVPRWALVLRLPLQLLLLWLIWWSTRARVPFHGNWR